MCAPSIPDEATRKKVRLSYKFQRLREQIRRDILSGQLSGRLPGERALADRYDANAKTVSKALTDLAVDGLLIRQVGRGTYVAGQVPPALTRPKKLLWIGAKPGEGAADQRLFESASQILAAQGHSVAQALVDLAEHEEVPERLLRPGQLRGLDGVLIVGVQPSRAFLADLLCRHIPVVTVDVHNPPARTDAVTADYAQGAYELATHLIQLGHENILFLCDNVTGTGADVAYHGYCAAVQRHGFAPRQARSCRLDPATGDLPADLGASLFDRSDGPTALLAFGLKLAQALHRAAAERSKPIPSGLSLAVLAEPTANLEHYRDWTYYQAEAHQLAQWATWLLAQAEPGQGPRQVVVPGRLKLGESTGPAQTPGRVPVSPRETVI